MINFILFIVLFGILVFIHEFGHFITAKKLGIGVEKFFLGWGPKIFSVKKGETEYGISWIPLGGYVKLVGEDPSEQKEGAVSEKSFMAKPPLHRIAVVSAGPVANLILPVILFGFLYFVGMPSLGPVIGEVLEGSPAAQGGFLQGDKFLKAGDEEIARWDDLTRLIRGSQGKEILVKIDRQGEILSLNVKPKLSRIENIFKEKIDGWTIGITPYQYEPAIGLTDENSPAYKAGLRNGDIIRKVNGDAVKYFWQFEAALVKAGGKGINLLVARGKEKAREEKSFVIPWGSKIASVRGLGIYRSELFIASVKPQSIAEEKGIKAGDMIESIDGQKTAGWMDLEKKISENNGEAITIGILRNAKKLSFNITPKLQPTKDAITGANEKKRELGIEPYSIMMDPPAVEVVERTYNPFKAVVLGSLKTYDILKNQTIGFAKLIQGKLSLKNIGGPILIYKLAGRSFEMGGIFSFISYIALLSIVLGFVNLLPIPILDGGHIFFYLIELIKRKPLSLRTREIAQNFGFVVIIGLLILASYNDINRYFWQSIVEFVKRIF